MPIWNGEDGAPDLAAEIAEDRAQRRDRIARVVPGNRSAEGRLSYWPITRPLAVSNGPAHDEVRRAVAVDVEAKDVDTDRRVECPRVPRIRRHLAPVDQHGEVSGESALGRSRPRQRSPSVRCRRRR